MGMLRRRKPLTLARGQKVPKAAKYEMNGIAGDGGTIVLVVRDVGKFTGAPNTLCSMHTDRYRMFFMRVPGRPDPRPGWR